MTRKFGVILYCPTEKLPDIFRGTLIKLFFCRTIFSDLRDPRECLRRCGMLFSTVIMISNSPVKSMSMMSSVDFLSASLVLKKILIEIISL